MADHLTKRLRSLNMSRIRATNTRPELALRSMLHRLGYRFRLHAADIPGKPDVVLKKYKTVILLHGCFWHRHSGCRFCTTPGTNSLYWRAKFRRNVRRDLHNAERLKELGWKRIVVWECELRNRSCLRQRLIRLLRPKGSSP